jgi:hypothetical protein
MPKVSGCMFVTAVECLLDFVGLICSCDLVSTLSMVDRSKCLHFAHHVNVNL